MGQTNRPDPPDRAGVADSEGQEQLKDVALVVDLDSTLCRTDTLHEALMRLALQSPWRMPLLALRVRDGKAAFKAHVADRMIPAPDSLVFDETVLALIRAAREEGRRVALVSASDRRVVQSVASHLGLFDEVLGTGDGDGQNLGGAAKAELLSARFGAGGFDYIGDCATDLPVWKAAHRAYSANPSAALARRAAAQGITLLPTRPRPTAQGRVRPYLRALRPHQWLKNILVFLPALTAQDFASLGAAGLAFVLFSLMASSVYLLNDLVDLPSDRQHARKRTRPFAAGEIPIAHGIAMSGGLVLLSLILAAAVLPPLFLIVLLGYFVITLAYSFALKRKLIVDVVTLAGLYTLRIIAGGAAVGIMPSPWLLAFSVFLFFSLAAIKRQAELVDQIRAGKEASPGRAYLSGDVSVVQIMAICAGQAAVLVFALYIDSPAVAALYSRPAILWLICPVLLYWLSRIAVLTHRGHMDDDPIVFAARDRISQLTVAVTFLILLAAEI